MNSNTFFSLKRFALLMKHDMRINGRTFIIVIVSFIAITAIVQISIWKASHSDLYQQLSYFKTFMLYYLILFPLVGYVMFNQMYSNKSSIRFFLQPASIFEKFSYLIFSRIILTAILLPTIYYLTINLLVFTIGNVFLAKIEYYNLFSAAHKSFFGTPTYLKVSYLTYPFSISIFVAYFTVSFRRWGILIAPLTILGIVGLTMSAFVIMSHIYYPLITKGFNSTIRFNELSKAPEFLIYLILILAPITFTLATYFKLKEKEI
jgi:hypothetical protein